MTAVAGPERPVGTCARGLQMVFTIHHRAANAFVETEADGNGYQRSVVLQARVRLERTRHARGHWVYRLEFA